MLAGQFLVGIGIGIDFPVSASYVSETMPKNARSRMMVATIALQSVGMLVGAAVALATLAVLAAPGKLAADRGRDRNRRMPVLAGAVLARRKARAG